MSKVTKVLKEQEPITKLHLEFPNWRFKLNSFPFYKNKNKTVIDIQCRNSTQRKYFRFRHLIPDGILFTDAIAWASSQIKEKIANNMPSDYKVITIDKNTGSIFIQKEIKINSPEYEQIIKQLINEFIH